jgi:hypothetical protein
MKEETMDNEAPGAIEDSAEPTPPEGMNRMDEHQFTMAVMLVNMAAQAFAPWREHMDKQGAQPDADVLLAMAMASYAGTIYGQLVAMGFAKDSEVQLWLDSLRANAELGVDAGKKHTARAMAEALAEEGGKPS